MIEVAGESNSGEIGAIRPLLNCDLYQRFYGFHNFILDKRNIVE